MRKPLTVLLTTTLIFSLASCGSSRMNPRNWFGAAKSRAAEAREGRNPLIPQESSLTKSSAREGIATPVGQITSLVAEKIPGGAILRVTGVSDYQGAFGVKLVEMPRDAKSADVLRLQLLALQPASVVGDPRTREIVAATKVTDQDLAGIRRIEVVGQRNVQTIRR